MEATLYTLLTSLTHWVQQHPALSGMAVFVIAMLESLVIIGLPVPGAVLMVGAGALIAFNAMELVPTLLWAIAGAITGDGLSFWLGYRYREQLRGMWPFVRFTRLFDRGEAFFARHGGKSIVFGRFVGPVRAIIPTIAGMMKMSPTRYLIINVLSAFAWAPAYILPGVIFGASLELASEVAMRLVVSLLALAVMLLAIRWLLRRTFDYLQPRTDRIIGRSMRWSHNHPLLGRVTTALIDPRQPESPALMVLALLLLAAGLGLFGLLQQVSGSLPMPDINHRVYQLMQGLRTPWMDNFMVTITMLGDKVVYGSLALVLTAWLLLQRNLTAAIHLLAALGFGAIATRILKVSLQVPRPPGVESGFSFPSAHATMSMVAYGFMAVLVARELRAAHRHWAYVGSGVLIIAIGISRLYLGVHWFLDVAAGILLGLVWTTLIGIAYRRHASPPIATGKLLALLGVTWIGIAATHLYLNRAAEIAHYTPAQERVEMQASAWWSTQWQGLPVFRHDITRERHPFNLQWAGHRTAIEAQLQRHGWYPPAQVTLRNLLQWLNPDPDMDAIPVLPHLHNGQQQEILLIHTTDQSRQRWVLRLWPTSITLQPGATPLWIGNVSELGISHRMGLFAYATTGNDFQQPLQLLQQHLQGLDYALRRRELKRSGDVQWDGEVVLIRMQDTGKQEDR